MQGLADGFFWVICGLSLLLVLTATLAVLAANRSASQDDRRLERTKPKSELRKIDRL